MYKKIFLDTNPIIYFLEDRKPYSTLVKKFLSDCMVNKCEFYTSTITDAEFMVKPYSENNLVDIETYSDFISSLNILKCYITETIASKAAQLRALYTDIKLADALQLAASIETGCDAFLTNDKQLQQVKQAHVLLLTDF